MNTQTIPLFHKEGGNSYLPDNNYHIKPTNFCINITYKSNNTSSLEMILQAPLWFSLYH